LAASDTPGNGDVCRALLMVNAYRHTTAAMSGRGFAIGQRAGSQDKRTDRHPRG
jgi:hypothetical protein